MSLGDEQSTVKAVVRSIEGGEAVVEVESGGCGRCHEKGGCGGQNLTQMFANGSKTYRVNNDFGAAAGDRVVVAITPGTVRQTANLAYGVPIMASLVGAIAGSALAADAGAMVGAAVALVLSFFYVRYRSARDAGNFGGRPHIVSRAPSNQEVCRQ